MIQRIQSVYLLLVVVAIVAFIFVPFGSIRIEDIQQVLTIKKVVPLSIASVVVGIVALVSIFLFNNRKLQMRVVLLNSFLSIVLIGLFIYGLLVHVGLDKYSFGAGAIFPIFIFIFNLLAYSAIKSDDMLVKSMDRLR
jgi:peptidoglycan/LPS O-acetylase OafA/YrhL